MNIGKYFLTMFVLILLINHGSALSKVLKVKSNDSEGLKKSFIKASDGDTILVKPGKYYGNYSFMGKAIVVKGIAAHGFTTTLFMAMELFLELKIPAKAVL